MLSNIQGGVGGVCMTEAQKMCIPGKQALLSSAVLEIVSINPTTYQAALYVVIGSRQFAGQS